MTENRDIGTLLFKVRIEHFEVLCWHNRILIAM